MKARVRFVRDGQLIELECQGLAHPTESASNVLARAKYEGWPVPVVVVESDPFSSIKAGDVIGCADAIGWWTVKGNEHREALIREGERLLRELPHAAMVRHDIERDLAVLRVQGASV